MLHLQNSLAETDREDVINWAEHLATAFPPDHGLADQMRVLLKESKRLPLVALRQAVEKGIGQLLLLPFHQTGVKIPLTLEEKEDEALRKSSNALRGVTESNWESLSEHCGSTTQNVRAQTWGVLVATFRNND